MTRWLVTGARGMLGRDVLAALAHVMGSPGGPTDVTAVDRDELDITDGDAVLAAVPEHDVVVNCAAWTDVDGAESHEATATAVNGDGPAHLAAACAGTGAVLLQVSTDYVFSGDATEPYPEDAPTDPRSAYGRSKAAGERAVLETLPDRGYVVRTAWLYGEHGRSFVRTMAERAVAGLPSAVVDDQVGQPTWSRLVAARLVELGTLAASGPPGRVPPGAYHAVCRGRTTWFDLARAVYAGVGADPALVTPTDTASLDRPADRPAWSVLADGRWAELGLPPLARWEAALAQALPVVAPKDA